MLSPETYFLLITAGAQGKHWHDTVKFVFYYFSKKNAGFQPAHNTKEEEIIYLMILF